MKSLVSVLVAITIFCAPALALAAARSRIYAARVGIDGQVIAPGFEIAASLTGVQENPRVAFFDGVFLVVWQDFRNGTAADILGVRISTDGQILDSTPLTLAVTPRSQVMPDVDADDDGFMVVWHGFQGTETFPNIYAARVGADGFVGQPVVIASGATPRIAWNGTSHMVAYYSVYGSTTGGTRSWLRMSKTATVLPQSGAGFVWSTGDGPTHYAVCAMPTSSKGWTILTHEESPNYWGRTVGIQRAINIDTEGVLMAGSPTASSGSYLEHYTAPVGAANWLDTSLGTTGYWPWDAAAVAPDGQYCVALWPRYHYSMSGTVFSLDNSDLYAARVDGWQPVDAPGIAVATGSGVLERRPALAGNGAGKMLAVYEKYHLDSYTEIVATPLTIDTSILVGTEVAIMSGGPGATRRANPAVAFGVASFLVVWQEGWPGI